jgi:hypothetical protein
MDPNEGGNITRTMFREIQRSSQCLVIIMMIVNILYAQGDGV